MSNFLSTQVLMDINNIFCSNGRKTTKRKTCRNGLSFMSVNHVEKRLKRVQLNFIHYCFIKHLLDCLGQKSWDSVWSSCLCFGSCSCRRGHARHRQRHVAGRPAGGEIQVSRQTHAPQYRTQTKPIHLSDPVLCFTSKVSLFVSTGTRSKTKSSGNVQTDTAKIHPPPSPLPPSAPKLLKNKALLCKPLVQNKGVSCKTQTASVEAQTGTDTNYQSVYPHTFRK